VESLGFDLLDRHVVDGRGDDVACTDATGELTFARLLERAAALAGGLGLLGVRPGDEVAVNVEPGNLQVVVVCALIRLGAVPGNRGGIRIADEHGTVMVHLPDHDVDLAVVAKAGRADPAPSRTTDLPDYRSQVRTTFAAVVDTLLAGSPIE
jgi:hypothetical protein